MFMSDKIGLLESIGCLVTNHGRRSANREDPVADRTGGGSDAESSVVGIVRVSVGLYLIRVVMLPFEAGVSGVGG
jgi:hypothetical protein